MAWLRVRAKAAAKGVTASDDDSSLLVARVKRGVATVSATENKVNVCFRMVVLIGVVCLHIISYNPSLIVIL